jgi:acetylornithine deacetylase/succinyl-diaminopimelate desuccinylase family protein
MTLEPEPVMADPSRKPTGDSDRQERAMRTPVGVPPDSQLPAEPAVATSRALGVDSTLAQSVIDQVDRTRDELVRFLQELLAFRTESQNPAATHFLDEADRCRDFLADFLAPEGFELTRWEARPSSFPRHPVLAGRLPGRGSGRSLAFNSHFDVVPAAEGSWSRDPWGQDVVDGRVYGRGAVDMKGGAAAALWAVRCLRAAGVSLSGDIWMHLVSDEEVVGFGSRECVDKLPSVDAVVVPEPTAMAVTPVTGGLEHMRIEIDGQSAHAGVRYRSIHAGGQHRGGVNAIEKMVKILIAMQELERQRGIDRSHPLLPLGFNTLTPGVIVGGNGGGHDGQLNVVTNPGTAPDYCSLEYNIWYLPGEPIDDVRREIEEYVRATCQTDPWLVEHPPRFTWSLRGISFPPAATDADHPIVQLMTSAVRAAGATASIEGLTAVTDLSWYQAKGIPGVIFSPGSIDQAHSPDEYVEVDKLVVATKALALMALAWCGAD